jgi:hypothetical protein
MKNQNIYNSFSFKHAYKKKLISFLKENTTIETGGYKIFDGTYNHLLQIPEEFAELIIILKKYNEKSKINKFLEIGYSHGNTNTILNKFFNFSLIVGVDTFGAHINPSALHPNIRFKNLILVCGDTKTKFIHDNLKLFRNFDLILIDADHQYNSVKNDFELALKLSHKKTLLLLHDINLKNSGSKKMWDEIKSSKKFITKEIIHKNSNLTYSYGVGLVVFK